MANGEKSWDLLFTAVRQRSLTAIKKSVAKGANINQLNINGETLLYDAVYNEDLKMVKILIKAGADLNLMGEGGETPLFRAARDSNIAVMRLLISAGADLDKPNEEGISPITELNIAVAEEAEIAKLLIKSGAALNQVNIDGETLLYDAVYNEDLEMVQILITAGADLNLLGERGETPLFRAAKNGHEDVAKALIAAGADINKAVKDGKTPLFTAAKNGHEDVVKALITAGANNYITDKSIRTPLFDTTVSGHSKEGESIKSYPLFGLFCALSVCGIITYLEKSGRRLTELLERVLIGELSETQIKRILESNLEDLTCPITYDPLDELTSIVAVGNHQNSLYSKAALFDWLVGQIGRPSLGRTFRDVATQEISSIGNIRDVTEAVRELLQNKQVTTIIQEVLADIITQISTGNEVEGEVLAVEPSDVAIMPEAVGTPETSFVAKELERRKQAELTI